MPNGRARENVAPAPFSAVVLPGYQAQPEDDAIVHSQQKLLIASKDLGPLIQQDGSCAVVSLPCTTEEETLGYRCKCSFQVILEKDRFQYAMRHKGEPVAIGSSRFPIANKRIQSAMEGLLENVLNASASEDGETSARFPHVSNKESLASLTFAASWNDAVYDCDNPLAPAQDCILTLNYNLPVEGEEIWLKEARAICHLLKLTQLHGRSRHRLLSAVSEGPESPLGSHLRDTLYLFRPSTETGSWQVSLQQKNERKQEQQTAFERRIPVHYQKPEGAFFHPNARVMCQALQWMLDRIATIAADSPMSCRLLEMYCGCGAHTLALAKSGLLASIQAVEVDPRLIDACKVNVDINTISEPGESGLPAKKMTPIQVARGDAGQWAQKQRKKLAVACNQDNTDFDILLVDPPRQGLDKQVIDMAIHVDSFQHVLIISCGHEALVRDLNLLCVHFEIINCLQLDLFPRTSSVETLVHLSRRSFAREL